MGLLAADVPFAEEGKGTATHCPQPTQMLSGSMVRS